MEWVERTEEKFQALHQLDLFLTSTSLIDIQKSDIFSSIQKGSTNLILSEWDHEWSQGHHDLTKMFLFDEILYYIPKLEKIIIYITANQSDTERNCTSFSPGLAEEVIIESNSSDWSEMLRHWKSGQEAILFLPIAIFFPEHAINRSHISRNHIFGDCSLLEKLNIHQLATSFFILSVRRFLICKACTRAGSKGEIVR